MKRAQGAKPGEGGQLAGNKINALIGSLRGVDPGVSLVSPPPHHDIYSIEEELFHAMLAVLAGATPVHKLVAGVNIGTIASGCAKNQAAAGLDKDGMAGIINIASGTGGTGAAELISLFNTGIEGIVGLADVHQNTTATGLRDFIQLRTSGSYYSGWQKVVSAVFGADQFEMGTFTMFLDGGVDARLCHTGGCPVGVAVQDALNKGDVSKIVTYFLNEATEMRYILAALSKASVAQGGAPIKTMSDLKGRFDLVPVRNVECVKGQIDFDKIRHQEKTPLTPDEVAEIRERRKWKPGYEDQLWAQIKPIISGEISSTASSEKPLIELDIESSNGNILFGTRLSILLANFINDELEKLPAHERISRVSGGANDGLTELRYNTIKLNAKGSFGEGLGSFLDHGIHIHLEGLAQNFVGNSLSGGVISIKQPENERQNIPADKSVAIGNTCLYGATAGALYCNGRAGDRFAVRNSGATAVIEGCDDFGCEYMTDGTIVVLGEVGNYFGAGVSGGDIFMLKDPNRKTELSSDVVKRPLQGKEMQAHAKILVRMLSEHYKNTGSLKAKEILDKAVLRDGSGRIKVDTNYLAEHFDVNGFSSDTETWHRCSGKKYCAKSG